MEKRVLNNGSPLRLSAGLTVSTRAAVFEKKSRVAMRRTLQALGDYAIAQARVNVLPGKGPSPHGHESHVWHNFKWDDTGDLAVSLRQRFRQNGPNRTVTIYTPLEYGVALEIGFRGPSGKLYRYPWLLPAFQKAQKMMPEFVGRDVRRALEEASVAAPVVYNDMMLQKMIADFKAIDAQGDKEDDLGDDIDYALEHMAKKRGRRPLNADKPKLRPLVNYRDTPKRRPIQIESPRTQASINRVMSEMKKNHPDFSFRVSKRRSKSGRPIVQYTPRDGSAGRSEAEVKPGSNAPRKKKK